MELDLAILNLNSIVTPVSSGPVRGRGMTRIECIKESNIGIMNGKIVYIGPEIPTAEKYIDGRGLIAIPGFIDCHTHIPFTGDRSREFLMRLEGKSYMDIMKAGGGIRSTSEAVRRTPATALMAESFRFLDSMLSLGVTTVEGKSGYGLEREGELKQLRVLEALGELHPIDVFSTFLGAHALPEEYSSRDEYLSSMIEIFDEVRKLTDTIDIFCEDGVFNVDQSRRYMLAAIESGFRIRIHADELSSSGGGLLAVELGAVSADHLISADDITIQALAKSDTIATLLPGTSFFLNESFARGRELIDRGAIVAIASDFNPGSCNIYNPFIVMFLAVTRCGLKVEEAITAYTANAAAVLGVEDRKGLIREGYDADLVLLRAGDYPEVVYNFSRDIVSNVIKNGNIVA
ncbi:MAG: imidazolonepropionase [Mesotoga sp.]|nr:imidazolonepropionase [Mesotoga sp.]